MGKFKSEQHMLENYDSSKYRTPDGYTSDIAVFTIVTETGEEKSLNGKEKKSTKRVVKLMLIKRAETDNEEEPNVEGGKWALPGGFVQPDETAFEAASRELEEETGVNNIHLKHFGVYDKPGRDPRGWIISNAHYAIVPEFYLEKREAADDATDVRLFNTTEVLELQLAFDHKQIILDAIREVEQDMLSTTVAKNFLPKEFTLEELRTVLLSVINDEVVSSKTAFFRKAPTLPFINEVLDENKKPKTTKPSGDAKRPRRLFEFVEMEVMPSIWRYHKK